MIHPHVPQLGRAAVSVTRLWSVPFLPHGSNQVSFQLLFRGIVPVVGIVPIVLPKRGAQLVATSPSVSWGCSAFPALAKIPQKPFLVLQIILEMDLSSSEIPSLMGANCVVN